MNILEAVKKAKETGQEFYWYYDDGSRSEYSLSKAGLLLNYYGDMATFNVERMLSDKFTFSKKAPGKHRASTESTSRPTINSVKTTR